MNINQSHLESGIIVFICTGVSVETLVLSLLFPLSSLYIMFMK